MTEHGIFTTTADFWIHFHPRELLNGPRPCVYWYAVVHCREHIVERKLPIVEARSKNAERTITGCGYLIPKGALFVTRQAVPTQYATDYDWPDATDRQAGLHGQHCVQLMVMKREIWLPERQLKMLNGRTDQLNGCDCELAVVSALRFEIKTECVRSDNLYVQKEESGHRVHFTPNGDERVTEMPFWEIDR
jgi:hypothetical protein